MKDIKDILKNIENIYGSNNSLNILKDFERVVDELDVYVYDNWIDGELVEGPKESRYWITCTFMWPRNKMPDPKGGQRLLDFGCKVGFIRDSIIQVRKIKTPNDIRPGTKKGKLDRVSVWNVEIKMPKKLMSDIQKGYQSLNKNKIGTPGEFSKTEMIPEPAEQQANETLAAPDDN